MKQNPNTIVNRPALFINSLGLITMQCFFSVSLLNANPQGGDVVAGGASISEAGGVVTVKQLTDKAIINWQDFSIGRGQTTNFIQPSATSAVLNRVIGGNISQIYGELKANGQVYLINSNGVVIGDTGVINTSGFIASTHGVNNNDFLNGGDLTFSAGNKAGGASVVNLGRISVSGGDVFLISDHVTNKGSITAKDGTVGLSAARGSEVLLVESGAQRLLVRPSSAGATDKDGVINKGSIEAINAELKAAGGNVYALAINNDGVVRATGVMRQGGRIMLSSKGGKIKLGSKSRLSASGENGGGSIKVGGDRLGQGAGNNASEVEVAQGSEVEADALNLGDGGEIIIFAEGNTSIAGNFSARGGSLSGNGGFIETSGGSVQIQNGTTITTEALAGTTGTWLIDPTDYTIGAGGDMTPAALVAGLANNNMTIMTSSTSAGNGDIFVNDAVLWDSENSLTLLAHRNVNFNASVQNSNAVGGDLNIVAGWNGTTAFNATTFDAQDVTATTGRLFGNNNGSINIGNGSQTTGIAAGSRNGNTRAYGYDITILAGNTQRDSFAQLGALTNRLLRTPINGDITVRTVNNISAIGGNGLFNNAQVGHLGARRVVSFRPGVPVNSDISIAAGNNLIFRGGGSSFSYVQLGHGGYEANGTSTGSVNGSITIERANNIDFRAGNGSLSYVQLGHGGFGTSIYPQNMNGNIIISKANDIVFAGGAEGGFAHLGHGGYLKRGNHSGSIVITNANDLTLRAGSKKAYAQLGHGGYDADGVHSGMITLSTIKNLNISGGGFGTINYAQLGHGGYSADGNKSGSIEIASMSNLNMRGGRVSESYTQIGHGGVRAYGNTSGSISINRSNNLDLVAGAGSASYAQIGHGAGVEPLAYGDRSGVVKVISSGELSLVRGSGRRAFWKIGHQSFGRPFGGFNNTVTDADIFIQAGTIDSVSFDPQGMDAVLDSLFLGHMFENLRWGDVTIAVTGQNGNDGNLIVDGAFNYNSTNRLTLQSSRALTINSGRSITNAGTGEVVLATDIFTNNGAANNITTVGGQTLIYSNDWAADTRGSLNGYKNLYNRSFAANDPDSTEFTTGAHNTNDYYIYTRQPLLSVTANDGAITYGDSFTPSSVITGFVNGDTAVNSISGSAGFNAVGRTAGSHVITPNAGTLSSDVGYGFSFNNGNLMIAKKALSLTGVSAQNKVYDGSLIATFTGGTLNGVLAGDAVSLSAGSGMFADKNVGVAISVTATGFSLSGADAGNYNLTGQPTGLSANITAKDISIVGVNALGKVYDGNTVASLTNGSLSGVVAGDRVGLTQGVGRFADKNVGVAKSVTATSYSLSGTDAGNYNLTGQPTGLSADITAKDISIVGVNALGKVYDGSLIATLTGGTLNGVLVGDAVSLSAGSGMFADKNVGVAKSVTATGYSLSGTDAGNYNLTGQPTGLSADITAKDISIVGVNALGKVYDGNTLAGLTNGSLSGVVVGDRVGLTQGVGRFADKNVGTGKTVTASGFGLSGSEASNYNLTGQPIGLSANIIAKDLSIVGVSALGKVYDGNAVARLTNGRLSGVVAGDKIDLIQGVGRFADKNVGTGKTVTASGFGLSGSEAGNYNLTGQPTGLSANITAKDVSIVGVNALGKVYDGNTLAGLTNGSLSGVVAGDRVGLTQGVGRFADKNVGTGKTVTASGFGLSGSEASNYNLTGQPIGLSANITAKDISIVGVNALGKVYDGHTIAGLTNGSLSGVVAGDRVGLTQGVGRFADKNAGIGKTVTASGFSLSGSEASNYNLTGQPTGLSATITPRQATVTAADVTRDFGTNNPSLTGSLEGFLAGDNISANYISSALETTSPGIYTSGDPLSIKPVLSDPSGELGNYEVTIVEGTLVIRDTRQGVYRQTLPSWINGSSKPTDTTDTSSNFHYAGENATKLRELLSLEEAERQGGAKMTDEQKALLKKLLSEAIQK